METNKTSINITELMIENLVKEAVKKINKDDTEYDEVDDYGNIEGSGYVMVSICDTIEIEICVNYKTEGRVVYERGDYWTPDYCEIEDETVTDIEIDEFYIKTDEWMEPEEVMSAEEIKAFIDNISNKILCSL